MILAFDTSILVSLEKKEPEVLQRLGEIRGTFDEFVIPALVYSEIYYGYLDKGGKRKEELCSRLDSFRLLNTTRESCLLFAELKKKAMKSGHTIQLMDLLIASIVMANGATLLTRDTSFKSIDELDAIIV